MPRKHRIKREVAIGQTWVLLINFSLSHFTISEINGDQVRGHNPGKSRYININRRVFERGLRSARLISEPTGEAVQHEGRFRYLQSKEEVRTASEMRYEVAPRGVCPGNAQRIEALSMFEQGKTKDEIAQHFGVTNSLVSAWIRVERERREDEKLLRQA